MSIAWRAWDEAFAEARAAGRPVLLALTASWCHACHRMDDEVWDDPGVAAQVERATVPTKVDADARPDVYARYHAGGLPSLALLAPDGAFIRGATYLTVSELHAFLDAAIGDWRAGRQPALRRVPVGRAPDNLVDSTVARLVRRADREHGGFGVAPKLPEVEAVTLLLRRWRETREDDLERIVRGALDAVVAHLGDARDGGFFRYAAGADWSGPHTEKLALDQAQIARALLEAGAALPEPRYLAAAGNALAHARRRLIDTQGRVMGSVTADPSYYARTATAPRREGGDDDSAADEFESAHHAPPVDSRRFADAAAAMLIAAAMEHALSPSAVESRTFGLAPEYRIAAPDGAISHRLDAPDSLRGLLRDQALGIAAAVMEYRLTGAPAALDWAEKAATFALAELWDDAEGAFRGEPPRRAANEIALPPMFPLLANGEMAVALADLADHTGRGEYVRAAKRVVAALGGRAALSPAGPALALAAQRLSASPPSADLTGDPSDPAARALARAVVAALGPTASVRWNGSGPASVIVCARDLCLPAIAEPREVLAALIEVDLAPHDILALWSSGFSHESS